MKQKTHKDFIAWIKKAISVYAPVLGVQDQIIKVQYEDDTEFMNITCTYPYLDPIIGFSEKAFEAWKKGEVPEDRVLHELCHMITDPLYCKAMSRFSGKQEIEDERERLTDTLCMIIRKLI